MTCSGRPALSPSPRSASRSLATRVLALSLHSYLVLGAIAQEQPPDLYVTHFFSNPADRSEVERIFDRFRNKTDITVFDDSVGYGRFTDDIYVRAQTGNLPDVFSYSAGAPTLRAVDEGILQPIDAIWGNYGLDEAVIPSIANGASTYRENKYLLPFRFHYVGMFFNSRVLDEAAITAPATWEELLDLCGSLRSQGIVPIALGSKNGWPAEFWFDYLLLRTAGPEYRARLMMGTASYVDAQVVRVMGLWKQLIDSECFVEDPNDYDWSDAADRVAQGEAAMTLMGTWITRYWDDRGLEPVHDYDLFEFPAIDDGITNAVLGSLDGWLVSANSESPANAAKLLSYLATDTESARKLAQDQSWLSANLNVDGSNYSTVIQRAHGSVIAADTFASVYDLATDPLIVQEGLAMFKDFMRDQSRAHEYLEKMESTVDSLIK